ncbi:hypothetical protein GB937_005196 [Aspergillus fischeri]|nr:hypothetical protein GB937_005196 [Aspergillus fischeri]
MHRDHAVRIPVLRAPAVAGMMAPGEEKRARQRAEAVAVVQRAQEMEGAEVHPVPPVPGGRTLTSMRKGSGWGAGGDGGGVSSDSPAATRSMMLPPTLPSPSRTSTRSYHTAEFRMRASTWNTPDRKPNARRLWLSFSRIASTSRAGNRVLDICSVSAKLAASVADLSSPEHGKLSVTSRKSTAPSTRTKFASSSGPEMYVSSMMPCSASRLSCPSIATAWRRLASSETFFTPVENWPRQGLTTSELFGEGGGRVVELGGAVEADRLDFVIGLVVVVDGQQQPPHLVLVVRLPHHRRRLGRQPQNLGGLGRRHDVFVGEGDDPVDRSAADGRCDAVGEVRARGEVERDELLAEMRVSLAREPVVPLVEDDQRHSQRVRRLEEPLRPVCFAVDVVHAPSANDGYPARLGLGGECPREG